MALGSDRVHFAQELLRVEVELLALGLWALEKLAIRLQVFFQTLKLFGDIGAVELDHDLLSETLIVDGTAEFEFSERIFEPIAISALELRIRIDLQSFHLLRDGFEFRTKAFELRAKRFALTTAFDVAGFGGFFDERAREFLFCVRDVAVFGDDHDVRHTRDELERGFALETQFFAEFAITTEPLLREKGVHGDFGFRGSRTTSDVDIESSAREFFRDDRFEFAFETGVLTGHVKT